MSEWRERALKRRDQRQTKVEVRPPSRSRRNTRRWCRGVEGREHKPVCVDYDELKGVAWRTGSKVLMCEVCQKQLAFYWVTKWRKQPPPPAWAK